MLAVSRRVPAELVDAAIACGRDQPARRTRRQAVGRPALHRDRESVLGRVFGNVDVTEDADQHRHHPAVLLPEDALNLGRQDCPPSRTGRTSTGSPVAATNLRLQASAASRSGAATMVKPPRCSFPSANGPSVMIISPPRGRITVAVLAGCSAPVKTQAPAALS